MASLVYAGERNHVVDYLRAKGWDVEGVTRTELFQRNGIDVPAPEHDDPLGEIIFISGRLDRLEAAEAAPSHSTLAPLSVCSTLSRIPATERPSSAPSASGSDAAAGCDDARGRTMSSSDEPG